MAEQISEITKKHKFDFNRIVISLCLIAMGILIILFNIKGYEILFNDEKLFGIVSPFSLLIAVAEISVLIWTYNVISEWPNSSRILKGFIFILVPSFSFLCFSGINSYLTIIAHTEYRAVQEVKLVNKNTDEYLLTKKNENTLLQDQLFVLRNERMSINAEIARAAQESALLAEKSSDRRKTAIDCSAVPDCAAAVLNIDSQISNIQNEISRLNLDRDSIEARIQKFEGELDSSLMEIDNIKEESVNQVNLHADSETSHQIKKQTYENIILSIAAWFGYVPKDPFSIFINLISFIIYPVYFILNLLLALNSESNTHVRQLKKQAKDIRFNKESESELKESAFRYILFKKMLKYFRVWAHARRKTKIKIVEKPVEKIIEKEVKVDRLVPVNQEVPIFVEKLVKVPEPYVVKEPQIIIKEKIFPVPEDITSTELEELVNEQLRFDTLQQYSEAENITENQRKAKS